MRIIFTLLIGMFMMNTNAQVNLNMEMVANIEFPGEEGNDIWGFVDSNGIEYAVIGTTNNTRVFSLADPANPEMVAEIPGASSIWRDMKSWNNHIYVTTDQGSDGLLIIDMSEAPGNITSTFWKPTIEIDGFGEELNTCHNLYIDENGICYLAGCNNGRGGAIILDITTDPNEPIVLGNENRNYAHDIYVRDDIMYCSEINVGELGVYDVSDKANPEFISSVVTSSFFTHNAWLSEDGNTIFTTDERPNAYVDAYDVSDLNNMERLDVFQPSVTAGNDVIPHNTHVIGNFLVTSWYTDGVVITDATYPDNMIEVGHYDTFLGPDGGFSGCWGVYPWLPSGLIIASDINTGLYVFNATYEQASYIQGTITDLDSGEPINMAEAMINTADNIRANANAVGTYKSGIAQAGTYDIIFSHPDYKPTTISTTLISGEITVVDAQLEKLETFVLTGDVFDNATGQPIENAKVKFTSGSRLLEYNTDAAGQFTATLFEEDYAAVAGAWGYLHLEQADMLDPSTTPSLSYGLDLGYMDDFVLDLDWNVSGDAETGTWVRETPIGTFTQGNISNIPNDANNDIGTECYMTGNSDGGVGDQDVDDGTTVLLSPAMDLSGLVAPGLQFVYHFFNGGGFGEANDEMTFNIISGNDVIRVLDVTENTNGWTPGYEIPLSLYTDDVSNIRLQIVISDNDPGHLVEGAIDRFRVIENVSSLTEINDLSLKASPNPFGDILNVSWDTAYDVLEIYNSLGQLQISQNISGQNNVQIDEKLNAGLYFLSLKNSQAQSQIIKLIKQ